MASEYQSLHAKHISDSVLFVLFFLLILAMQKESRFDL